MHTLACIECKMDFLQIRFLQFYDVVKVNGIATNQIIRHEEILLVFHSVRFSPNYFVIQIMMGLINDMLLFVNVFLMICEVNRRKCLLTSYMRNRGGGVLEG